MSRDAQQWCVLKRRIEVGSEHFEAGDRFRVAWRHQRGEQESLTLDGNGEAEDWTSARIIHNVPVGEVEFLRTDTTVESVS